MQIEQAQIQQRADVLDVIEVVGQLAADAAQVGVGRKLHLGQPRNAGPHGQALAVGRQLALQFREELRPFRPRPDQAHVAAQDVQQLRQFVEMRGPHEPADPRDARVAGHRPTRPRQRLAVMDHGANLINREEPAATADADLRVKGGAARGQLDDQGGRGDERQGDRSQHQSRREIDGVLARQIPAVNGTHRRAGRRPTAPGGSGATM